MSASDEILDLIMHPFRDVKVFTTAQILFISMIIFIGVGGYIIYKYNQVTQGLEVGAVGGIVTGLFLAAYSFANKKKETTP